jgi:transcriptional regulator GlxA family with amidase domain
MRNRQQNILNDFTDVDARVIAAIDLMRKIPPDRFSVSSLANRLNVSPGRLRQLFKRETGQSPIQYFRHLRLQQAEKLLRSTFLNIKEVTFLCGMKDVSHFVRDFKKRFGRTPSEYRSQVHRAEGVPSPR